MTWLLSHLRLMGENASLAGLSLVFEAEGLFNLADNCFNALKSDFFLPCPFLFPFLGGLRPTLEFDFEQVSHLDLSTFDPDLLTADDLLFLPGHFYILILTAIRQFKGSPLIINFLVTQSRRS